MGSTWKNTTWGVFRMNKKWLLQEIFLGHPDYGSGGRPMLWAIFFVLIGYATYWSLK